MASRVVWFDLGRGRVVNAVASRVATVATGAVLCVAALGACGGTSTPPVPPDATSAAASPSPAPSPSDAAKAAALDAYRGMWADFVAAGTTSDWQSARLGDHATGLALTNLSRGLYADKRNGLATRGAPKFDPHVASAEPVDVPTKAIVTDCADSSSWLKYRVSDGSPADDATGGRRVINAAVERQSDGSWKVSDFGVQAVGTC